jgi:hypothetical protein
MSRRAASPLSPPRSRAAAVAAALAPVAAATGSVADDGRTAPQWRLGGTISALARDVGMTLAEAPIFLSGDEVVTVSPSGVRRQMSAIRFTSWSEGFGCYVNGTKDGDRAVSISAELAAKIIVSDDFRDALRPLRAVIPVRLPVWGDDDQTTVRLLPSGYDPATQTLTLDELPYADDMHEDEAWDWLQEVYGGFPFAEAGEGVKEKRSFGVQIGAHFAVYCRNLLAGGARPVFCYQGNQPGVGKSVLSRMAIAPVFGEVAIQAFPAKEEELGKLLTASAAEGVPILYFDNIRGRLASSELESFVTSPVRTGRRLGVSGTITAPNTAQIFLTGNGLSLSPDLARRACVVELFLSGEAGERKFAHPITESWLVKRETRAKFLASLWALLKVWERRTGCAKSDGVILGGFEEFSGIVGGIVQAISFPDPMARSEVAMDEVGEAWQRLLREIAEKVPDGVTVRFTAAECLEMAEQIDVLDVVTGGAKDAKKAFGQRLKRWQGREFIDGLGRRFEFGTRHRTNTVAGYPVTILSKAEAVREAA